MVLERVASPKSRSLPPLASGTSSDAFGSEDAAEEGIDREHAIRIATHALARKPGQVAGTDDPEELADRIQAIPEKPDTLSRQLNEERRAYYDPEDRVILIVDQGKSPGTIYDRPYDGVDHLLGL